jgi:hypothetical protein
VNRDFLIGLPSSTKSCQKSPVSAVCREGELTLGGTLEGRHNLAAVEREVRFNDRTVATVDIDYRQYPEAPAVHEAIDHEVHGPTFVRSLGWWSDDSQVAGQLASSFRPHSQAQAFLPVQPA